MTIAAALIAVSAPAASATNPLLSGYGGPGQGAQAIIGGGLINPPGGGSAGGSPPATASQLTVSPSPTARSTPAKTAGKSRSKHGSALGRRSRKAVAKAAPATSPTTSVTPVASVSSGGSGGALGLTGGDALLMLLVLVCLAGTAALTRQLARRAQ